MMNKQTYKINLKVLRGMNVLPKDLLHFITMDINGETISIQKVYKTFKCYRKKLNNKYMEYQYDIEISNRKLDIVKSIIKTQQEKQQEEKKLKIIKEEVEEIENEDDEIISIERNKYNEELMGKLLRNEVQVIHNNEEKEIFKNITVKNEGFEKLMIGNDGTVSVEIKTDKKLI